MTRFSLRTLLLAVCLPFLPAGGGWARASLIDIGSRAQLFIDDVLVLRTENVKRKLNPAVKVEDNPVIPRDRPWEGSDMRLHWIIYDEALQKFRMRYGTGDFVVSKTGSKSGEPNAEGINFHVCEAISPDGVHWEKPNLGLVQFQGSKANNILPPETTKIEFLVYDQHETDPLKRYKGLIRTGEMDQAGMVISLYYSADSYHWVAYDGNPIINLGRHVGRWGPTTFMGWDPIRKTYAVHMEYAFHMNGGSRRRSIGRAESPDMIHWSEPELILEPDGEDFPDVEFYSLGVADYEGYYVGLLWNFSTTNTLYTSQFVFSRDGIHYDRNFREAYVPRGDNGSFDSVCVYTGTPLIHGNKIYIYYTGVNWRSPENLRQLGGKARARIGLATAEPDSFVSLDSGRTEGSVTTRPFSFSGGALYLNVKRALQGWGAGKAEARVEILNSGLTPIDGFTRNDADPIVDSSAARQATWKGSPDLGKLQGRSIALRIFFKNLKLYSFQFR